MHGFAPGLPMGADEPRQDGSRPAVKAEPCSYYCQEEYLTVLVDLGPQVAGLAHHIPLPGSHSHVRPLSWVCCSPH